MSGATLAAGPRYVNEGKGSNNAGPGAYLGGVMGSFRVIELQLVAFIVVFSVSGLVPLRVILYPLGVTIYSFLISAFVFPKYKEEDLHVVKGNRGFQFYVITGTVLGLFLPLAFVLGGFARNDQQSVRVATPHLFLLSCQILSEDVVSGTEIFSLPVKALLPILYTGRRLFELGNWVAESFAVSHLPRDPTYSEAAWFWFGRGLAISNMVYFAVNLFGFLLPVFLPRAFERYFEARNTHVAEEKKRN